MNEIILGEEQQTAINLITTFITNPLDTVFSLMGYAGTGKSTIIKWLIEYLENKGISYILAAPTHKARAVMTYATNREAKTLHQVLKLFPNINLLELDMRDLSFVANKGFITDIPYHGVIICDESSMINDLIFELLTKKCLEAKAKIIFVGDPAQLKPVKSFNRSLVFNTPNKYELTKIYRQSASSGLYDILVNLRTQAMPRFSPIHKEDGSLYCINTAKDLFAAAIPYFKQAIADQDIFAAKMYAYTNNRTKALNAKLRNTLFSEHIPYNVGEILTCYDNISYGYTSYWNSMDYIIDKPAIKTQKNIPHVGMLPGYILSLYDPTEDISDSLFILDHELRSDFLFSLSTIIEETRIKAIHLQTQKNRNAQYEWKKYYEIINSFTTPIDLVFDNRVIKRKTFDYGYASTVHKS